MAKEQKHAATADIKSRTNAVEALKKHGAPITEDNIQRVMAETEGCDKAKAELRGKGADDTSDHDEEEEDRDQEQDQEGVARIISELEQAWNTRKDWTSQGFVYELQNLLADLCNANGWE